MKDKEKERIRKLINKWCSKHNPLTDFGTALNDATDTFSKILKIVDKEK